MGNESPVMDPRKRQQCPVTGTDLSTSVTGDFQPVSWIRYRRLIAYFSASLQRPLPVSQIPSPLTILAYSAILDLKQSFNEIFNLQAVPKKCPQDLLNNMILCWSQGKQVEALPRLHYPGQLCVLSTGLQSCLMCSLYMGCTGSE